MIKYIAFFCCFGFTLNSFAQTHSFSDMDAVYMATLKAVVDYKMNDKENIDKIQKLREDKKFNQDLQEKLDKLSNKKSKSGKDKRIYEILKNAGKKIYNEL